MVSIFKTSNSIMDAISIPPIEKNIKMYNLAIAKHKLLRYNIPKIKREESS